MRKIKVTPEMVVEVARTYIGTPWHHAGRLKGVGIDCAGLLVGVSEELGIPIEDDVTYSRNTDNIRRMLPIIEKYCDRLSDKDEMQMGDILVFRGGQGQAKVSNHCSIYTGNGNHIHAYDTGNVSVVTENNIDDHLGPIIFRRYRYKALKKK